MHQTAHVLHRRELHGVCRAEALGLVLKGSVAKSTKLLILGSTKGTSETSKQKTARKYGTPRLCKDDDIQELERMVQQTS